MFLEDNKAGFMFFSGEKMWVFDKKMTKLFVGI